MKAFSSLDELLHEEEVLYNEAARMHASPNLLKSMTDEIEKAKVELIRHLENKKNDKVRAVLEECI